MACSFHDLPDELVRNVLRRLVFFSARNACGRSCRRLWLLVRADETLWVELCCSSWPSDLPGIGRPRIAEGTHLVAPLAIGIDERTLPTFADELRGGLELLQLAHRRTAARVGVRQLRLHRRRDLSRIMPGLTFHVAACVGGRIRAEVLTDITLVQCSLPSHLGLLLGHVRCLRLWDCVLARDDAEMVQALAAVPLETLVWVSHRQQVPIELLEITRERPLRTLALSLEKVSLASSESVYGLPISMHVARLRSGHVHERDYGEAERVRARMRTRRTCNYARTSVHICPAHMACAYGLRIWPAQMVGLEDAEAREAGGNISWLNCTGACPSRCPCPCKCPRMFLCIASGSCGSVGTSTKVQVHAHRRRG